MDRAFKEAMRTWESGVCLVTASLPGRPSIGIVCNSFTAVSLDPQLVLWCVDHSSTSIASWREVDAYALHFLPNIRHPFIARFAMRGGDKFAGLDYELNEHGSPIFTELPTRFDCVLYQRLTVGDHDLMVGQPTNITFPSIESEKPCLDNSLKPTSSSLDYSHQTARAV